MARLDTRSTTILHLDLRLDRPTARTLMRWSSASGVGLAELVVGLLRWSVCSLEAIAEHQPDEAVDVVVDTTGEEVRA